MQRKKVEEIQWDLIPDHTFEDVHEVYGQDSNGDGDYDQWAIYEDADDKLDVRLFDANFDGNVDLNSTMGLGLAYKY